MRYGRVRAFAFCMGLLIPSLACAETGLASWYGGKRHHGARMANGRIFNQWGHSAAHKTLPFGTRVRIRNLANGRTADVTIEDRGPFIQGRVIDVSPATAGQLDMLHAGLARVELRVLP